MSKIPGTTEEFRACLDYDQPGKAWPPALKAIWWDFQNNWERSHDIAQALDNDTGRWIHGYLHRKEGDRFNAGYWYNLCGRPYPSESLEEEQGQLLLHILGI